MSNEPKHSDVGASYGPREPLGSEGHEASEGAGGTLLELQFHFHLGVRVIFIIGYAMHCEMYKICKHV